VSGSILPDAAQWLALARSIRVECEQAVVHRHDKNDVPHPHAGNHYARFDQRLSVNIPIHFPLGDFAEMQPGHVSGGENCFGRVSAGAPGVVAMGQYVHTGGVACGLIVSAQTVNKHTTLSSLLVGFVISTTALALPIPITTRLKKQDLAVTLDGGSALYLQPCRENLVRIYSTCPSPQSSIEEARSLH